MELNKYDIIKNIVVTGKSSKLFDALGKITFYVHRAANKVMIRQAVEKIWDVKVDNVRVISVHGKQKTFSRRIFKMADTKKAIITLKKGYKIDLPGQFESMGLAATATAQEEEPKGK